MLCLTHPPIAFRVTARPRQTRRVMALVFSLSWCVSSAVPSDDVTFCHAPVFSFHDLLLKFPRLQTQTVVFCDHSEGPLLDVSVKCHNLLSLHPGCLMPRQLRGRTEDSYHSITYIINLNIVTDFCLGRGLTLRSLHVYTQTLRQTRQAGRLTKKKRLTRTRIVSLHVHINALSTRCQQFLPA